MSWLWPGYIALGKLTVLDGDPGLGKSSMLLDVAARVSTGRELPDGSCGDIRGPAGTVLLSAEDGLADTVRPRLDAAGADTTRIAALEATRVVNLTTGETEEEGITLADLTAIEEAVSAVRAKLVIIDPLMAYLSAETNSYRDQDVRRVLTPLTRLAERLGVAVVIVRHFSKTVGGSAVYRGSGSIGIIGAARLGLMVAADPDDPDGLRRVLAVTKSNLAKKPPALAYTLQDAENGVARIEWLGSTGHTASSLVAVPDQGADDHGALAEAKDVLQQILRDGRVKASDVKTQAKEAGISEITLKRAKKALGVKAVRDGFGSAGVWYWHLPVNWEQSKGIIQSEGDHLFGDDPLWDSVIPFDSYQREVAGGIEDGEVAD